MSEPYAVASLMGNAKTREINLGKIEELTAGELAGKKYVYTKSKDPVEYARYYTECVRISEENEKVQELINSPEYQASDAVKATVEKLGQKLDSIAEAVQTVAIQKGIVTPEQPEEPVVEADQQEETVAQSSSRLKTGLKVTAGAASLGALGFAGYNHDVVTATAQDVFANLSNQWNYAGYSGYFGYVGDSIYSGIESGINTVSNLPFPAKVGLGVVAGTVAVVGAVKYGKKALSVMASPFIGAKNYFFPPKAEEATA